MKKLLFLNILFFTTGIYAQKVSDIMEHGIAVKDNEDIFLKLDTGTTEKLRYGKLGSGHFPKLKNETFFLIHDAEVDVNLMPLNPLRFSNSIELTFQPDEINATATEALKSILTSIGRMTGQIDNSKTAKQATVDDAKKAVESAKAEYDDAHKKQADANQNAVAAAAATGKPNKWLAAQKAAADAAAKTEQRKAALEEANQKLKEASDELDCIKKIDNIRTDIEGITKLLATDKKTDIAAIFTSLKDLNFLDKESTKKGMDAAEEKLNNVDNYYKPIKAKLDAINQDINAYGECNKEDGQIFINVYVLKQILKDLQLVYTTCLTRVSNLRGAHKVVTDRYGKMKGTGENWFLPLKPVDMEDDKIASTNIIINYDGYELSKDSEIVKSDKRELVSATLKFRKFQRFVPEVSAGIAYTQLSFPKYATETDPSTGKLRVADAGKEEFKQVNFTSMINFNYYLPNSPIHPFWQIGIGANADYPTILTGVGLRLNVGLNRLALSTGFAGTWINTLQTLDVGKEVESDAALQKDLKHEFSFPLKPYFGIQMNF